MAPPGSGRGIGLYSVVRESVIGMHQFAPPLPITVAYVVEKLALCLAERQQGVITASQLMPYLPLSLQLITSELDALVDGSAVVVTRRHQLAGYEFAAYRDTPAPPGVWAAAACVLCGTALERGAPGVLCATCADTFHQALRRLSTPTDWRTQATHEHDILYSAAQHTGPVTATALARSARTPLRQLQPYLMQMGLEGYLHQDVDLTTGLLTYTFPSVTYPRRLYQHNLATLHALRSSRPFLRRLTDWRLLVPLAGLAGAGLVLSTLFPAIWQRAPTPPAAERPLSAARPPLPQPYEVIPVRVSLGRDGFTPVGMTVSAVQAPPCVLTEDRPADIVTEPAYQGSHRKYGLLRLGSGAHQVYHIAFDVLPGRSPVLYVDRNQNGNLADDGPPLANRGTGFFATTLRLPLALLLPQLPFPGDYEAWLFSNQHLWQNGLMTYYSRTQFKGTLRLAGRVYTVYVAERGENDADFTNDGIYIDLDGDGKIDTTREFVPPGSSVQIADRRYSFDITW